MFMSKSKESSSYSAFSLWIVPQGIQIIDKTFFIIEKSPLIKVEEMIELESHEFASPNEIMDQSNVFH